MTKQRKWHLKLTIVRLQTWSLTEDMKILCIKDYVCSNINGFWERIRDITTPSFDRGRLFEQKKEEEDDEQSVFFENHRSCIFYSV